MELNGQNFHMGTSHLHWILLCSHYYLMICYHYFIYIHKIFHDDYIHKTLIMHYTL